MGSRRRYEIVRSTSTRLELALKLDELPRTPFNRCTVGTDGTDDCNFFDSPPGTYKCLEVRPGEPRRCVRPCDVAVNGAPNARTCRLGTVCETIPGAGPEVAGGRLCVEGPPLIPGCWPRFAPYKVQAGQAFTIAGSSSARPLTVKRDMGGTCVPDDKRHPFLVNRIPLELPHCMNVADGAPSLDAVTSIPTPNPCWFLAPNTDDAGADREIKHVKVLFENPQLRFLFTNLEEYAGDALSMRFDVQGGFTPDVAIFQDDVILTAGVRIVTGPNESPESPSWLMTTETGPFSFPYLYVVDQGRTSSTLGGRGQILRLNPRSSSTAGLPRFDSLYSTRMFQIQ
jgi:hypothetical protein